MAFLPDATFTNRYEKRTWLVVHERGLVARREAGQLAFPTDSELELFGARMDDAHRLGTLDETDALALPATGHLPEPFEALGLRALAALLSPEMFGVVGRAMHTCDWLSTNRFCGRCGTPTTRSATERCVECPSCRLRVFPRISPAIITLVRKGDLALLARNAAFPGAFYSTLAGFADIGESLEETLVREVEEEVSVKVKNVRYFGSQPWPFPNSLMVGFTADWASGEIAIDPKEIADAQWFSADALPEIPPRLSIARRLIDAWVAEVLGPGALAGR
ncbi:MAG: NAD(+) diphosphatase [Myxococcales bacterium]|nr:NAD(+) diphosphatase [Myxococcales bacterium]